MILQETSSRRFSYIGISVLMLGLLGLMAFLLPETETQILPPPEKDPAVVICGAEQVVYGVHKGDSDSSLMMVGDQGVRLLNGETQSDEQQHSGKFSCKVDDEHNFGMTYIFRDVLPNDRFRVSVWKYNISQLEASLVTHITGIEDGYKRHSEVVEVKENGWKKIETRVIIPYAFTGGDFRVYVYGYGLGEAYFDDLVIKEFDLLIA